LLSLKKKFRTNQITSKPLSHQHPMKKSSEPKTHHLVPANLQSIRAIKKTDESPTDPTTTRHTLDESFYKTAAGHWKHRDEPGEPRKTEYLTIAPDALRKQKQWDARQRLKAKGAVPTKQGKKLFDEFMRKARRRHSSAKG
jgi:hypothetical protein